MSVIGGGGVFWVKQIPTLIVSYLIPVTDAVADTDYMFLN